MIDLICFVCLLCIGDVVAKLLRYGFTSDCGRSNMNAEAFKVVSIMESNNSFFDTSFKVSQYQLKSYEAS
jgi:hypothetical protein